MKVRWPKLRVAGCLMVVAFAGAGCAGISATQSVSPIDFLLPGAGKLLHLQNTPPVTPLNTNNCIAASQPVTPPSDYLE